MPVRRSLRRGAARLAAGRWSLRTRLVAAAVGLSAVALTIAGFAGVTLLHNYLLRQVDAQLRAGVGAGVRISTDGPTRPPLPPEQRRRQLPTPLVFTVLDASGRIRNRAGGSLAGDSAVPDLRGLTLAQVTAKHGRAFTVPATNGSADFRVRAQPLADGSGSMAVAISLHSVDQTVGRLRTITLVTAAIVLTALIAVAVVAVRIGLRPLRAVERTAARIAGGDLSQRVPPGPPGTEVGRLAGAVNDMLAQIEANFAARAHGEETLRQFVADASHELRTPLTTVRGYAELVRRGALPDEQSAEHAMRRIEAEATRMSRLVDDLLLLAYLDQQRPLHRAPVDLRQLVGEAVADARARDPQRPIDATLPGRAVVVDGDADRLRQVLGNVLGNALTHTPPGTPVRVGLAERDAEVELTVADDGPGLAPEQASRVFERFYRADPGRSRARGGSGLGLAIVAAVVAASGGRVACASAPGAGTTITVTLPRADVPAAVHS
ncbi:MAG TPA: HAMP domain-containing sensor histidine kinase [Jatrophihabitans sp.]|nr:HAMP domain-containing sensor histidine kinase [Jatrophihabitans sp.]